MKVRNWIDGATNQEWKLVLKEKAAFAARFLGRGAWIGE